MLFNILTFLCELKRLTPTILDKESICTFSRFRTISFHHKWNATRLLSPECECTNCLMSFRTTGDLGSQEIKNFKKSLKCLDLMASTQPIIQKVNFDIYA